MTKIAAANEIVIAIESDDRGGLRSRVLAAPRGSGSRAAFEPPLPLADLSALLASLGERVRGAAEGSTAATALPGTADGLGPPRNLTPATARRLDPNRLGEALFAALMRDDVANAWSVSAEVARREGRSLRLRLELDPNDPLAEAVAALPWELIREPRSGTHLARSGRHAVVRSVSGTASPAPSPASVPLRVLLVAPAPRSRPCLRLGDEAAEVAKWLDALPGVEVELPEPATADGLRRRLALGGVHVFHFMGHAGFDPDSGRPVLLFADAEGGEKAVDAEHLADLLDDCPGLRLAVLNACDTARLPRRGATQPFAATATTLLRRGLAAVVAMQHPVTDLAARRFSSGLYGALAQGEPIDTAVTRGRQQMVAVGAEGSEWATPVLYLGGSDADVLGLSAVRAAQRRRQRLAFTAVAAGLAALVVALVAGAVWRDASQRAAERYVRPAVTTAAECPSPPGLEDMVFVRVDPGRFLMGDDKGAKDEHPAHEVEIPTPFCFSAFEITRGQWRQVMDDDGEPADPASATEADLPQGGVDWPRAQEFLRRLNQRVGAEVFRLPTEAEWEYAARAGTTTRFSFGDDATQLPRYGNCLSGRLGEDDGFDRRTAPVGSFAPNPWGLYDVHGNVWEWVEGAYGPYPGAPEDAVPDDAVVRHTKRGGSYENRAEVCGSASRSGVKADSREAINGLRVVREVAAR